MLILQLEVKQISLLRMPWKSVEYMKYINATLENISNYINTASEVLREEITETFNKNIENKSLIENMKWRDIMGTYIWKIIESEMKKELSFTYLIWDLSTKDLLMKIQKQITSEVKANY